MIVGWDNLAEYCGFWEHSLRKWMAYGDFPKPLFRYIKTKAHVWDKAEVDAWLKIKLESF